MPQFVLDALEERGLVAAYKSRPPYQQNDYLGWINRAKRAETKERRLHQMLDELKHGDVYMKLPYKPRVLKAEENNQIRTMLSKSGGLNENRLSTHRVRP